MLSPCRLFPWVRFHRPDFPSPSKTTTASLQPAAFIPKRSAIISSNLVLNDDEVGKKNVKRLKQSVIFKMPVSLCFTTSKTKSLRAVGCQSQALLHKQCTAAANSSNKWNSLQITQFTNCSILTYITTEVCLICLHDFIN